MNLVLLDADCRDLDTQKQIKMLLQDPEPAFCVLDSSMMPPDTECNITGIPEDACIEKAVFLTRLTGGVKEYHIRLLCQNTQVHYWIISVLDVEYEAHKKQFTAAFNTFLQKKKVRYEILFDETQKLENTALAYQEGCGPQDTCVVVTNGSCSAAKKISGLLRRLRPEWELLCCPRSPEQAYRRAGKILIAGSKPEDFTVWPVLSGTDRVFLWIEEPAGIGREDSRKRTEEITKAMTDVGWSLSGLKSRIMTGLLTFEEIYCDLADGTISAAALRSMDQFVMWDEYGLPLTDSAYDDEKLMLQFLHDRCCLFRLFSDEE